jgi:Zn-dependent protease with chaperone function
MSVSHYRYPERPKNVNEDITKPTEAFRHEVARVVTSIFRFIVTYIALVLAGIALAIGCAWAGFWVVSYVKNLWTLAFGIGLIGFGVMVLYFLLKFVFKRKTIDRSGMIEITVKDQPVLFDFIKKLAEETQTPLPKRIYLSPNVNAGVFYDSSFWSMFLPVSKNLNIGLGLVNSVNVSEFKGVIAHEFGHFSQKSMKVGSYVYNVNHIIHDMLFDNDDYERTLATWGNASQYFYFFAELTGIVVKIIKEILEDLYAVINERYMALSRQMEFHADAVAASVSGSTPLIHALYRSDIAESCYLNVLSYCDAWTSENRKARNVYELHSIAMKNFADAHHLTVEHSLSQASAKYYLNRVIIKDQWASHPSIIEREKQLNHLNIDADIVTDSAWTLFTNVEKLQREVTETLYRNDNAEENHQWVDGEIFRAMINERTKKYSLDKRYKGFYDNRNIVLFEADTVAVQHTTEAQNLSDLLTEKILSLPRAIDTLNIDIQILDSLQSKSSKINTFDFEGRKYDREEAVALSVALKHELKQATAGLEQADREVFLLFYKKASSSGKESMAVGLYNEMFALFKKTAAETDLLNSLMREASQLFQRNVTQGMALAVTNNMKRKGEEAKNMIREMLLDENYLNYYSETDKKTLQMFVDDNRKYFFNIGFDSEAINLYVQSLAIYKNIITERNFAQRKKTLETQIAFIYGEFEITQTQRN